MSAQRPDDPHAPRDTASTAPAGQPAAPVTEAAGTGPAATEDDPYRWLEDVTGEEPLAWVRERNAETQRRLTEGPRFAQLRDEIRQVLDSDERIPDIVRREPYRYNFWKDAAHPRGLWRRTTLDEYRKDDPDWDVLLDVDALAAAEGESWVWAGAQVLRPEYRRGLISLSRGGADATVLREFDLERREFVAGGFEAPEAKTFVDWIDADHIWIGTDFGPGSMTSSGYPRTARIWRRGTPLSEAVTAFEGDPDDVAVSAYHHDSPGYERDFVHRALDFYHSRRYLRTAAGELRLIDVPDDATIDVHHEWLLVELRTSWTPPGGPTYPAGALLATRFDEYVLADDPAGRGALTVLFEPDAHTFLAGYSWTRSHLILNLMRDVATELRVLTPGEAAWASEPLTDVPPLVDASAVGTDEDEDEEYLLRVDGYLTPPTLGIGTIGGRAEPLKSQPEFFDADGMRVAQRFTTSDDGTRVPYFVVRPAGDAPLGGWPTLLYGYGGFEIPLKPAYSGSVGRAWLARGGCFVVANIRGGGEYGPDWHQAALREHRHRAYEDFAAVARDLVDSGITTRERLGIQGGSNGGLLMGVMLTTYPELFGAVVAQVPLADMRRYHQLLAGASWRAEFGDPDDPDDWAFLQRYSPYHRLRPDAGYPPVLFTTSTRDDRVHPAHARKMTARLRELGHRVSYYENIEGGHGGAADNAQRAFMSALAYEFLWQQLAPDAG